MGNVALEEEVDAVIPAETFHRVQESAEFQELRKRHRSFVFPVAIAFLLWYFAYVLLAGYAHDFMSIKVFGSVNIGLLLGLAQIVSTFAITTWYVSFAGRRLDPIAAGIRHEIEGPLVVATKTSATKESK